MEQSLPIHLRHVNRVPSLQKYRDFLQGNALPIQIGLFVRKPNEGEVAQSHGKHF